MDMMVDLFISQCVLNTPGLPQEMYNYHKARETFIKKEIGGDENGSKEN